MITGHFPFLIHLVNALPVLSLLLAVFGLGELHGIWMKASEKTRFYRYFDREVPWHELNVCHRCRATGPGVHVPGVVAATTTPVDAGARTGSAGPL